VTVQDRPAPAPAPAPVPAPPAAPGRRAPARRPGGVATAVLLVLVGVLVVPPLVTVVVRSLTDTTLLGDVRGFTLDHFRDLAGPGLGVVALNTLLSSLGATAVGLVVGGVLAWVVERTDAPGAAACRVLVLLSLATPYVLYAIAWIMILGPDGPVNGPLRAVFGLSAPPFEAYGLPTMVLVEGLIAVPLAFLFLSALLRTMDASLEEAAAVAGAGPLTVLRRVSGPMVLPGLVGVGLLVLIRTVEAFEIPALIGLPGDVRVMTTSIFLDTKDFPPDYGTAGAYALVLMIGVVALLAAANRLNRHADRFATIAGKSTRPRRLRLGRLRWAGTAVIVLYGLVALAAPLLVILWASLVPFYAPPSLAALPTLTLDNYAYVLDRTPFLSSLGNTAVVGVASACLIVAVAVVVVWLRLRRRARGSALLEQLAMTPLVVPGVIMGFAVAALYVALPLPVYGTLLILVVGYTARYLPFGLRYAGAGMIQVHPSLEEAAATSGAGSWRTLWSVLLPLCRPALVAGWVFVLLMASKELSMAVLLATPGHEVVSVVLYQQWNNGQTTQAAAMGVLWTALTGALMTVFLVVTRRRGVSIDA
jgi:iron(III) transport system permease protein